MPSNADYAKINIGCKALGLDKRQLLADRYGLETSKDLTGHQVRDLLGHFRRLGWRAKPPRKTIRPQHASGPLASDPQARMIRGLWITMGKAGVIRDPAETALNGYCKRMCKVDALAFTTVTMKIGLIENLKKWQARDLLETYLWLLLDLDLRFDLRGKNEKSEMIWLTKRS
jgi:phage gp16-like protein